MSSQRPAEDYDVQGSTKKAPDTIAVEMGPPKGKTLINTQEKAEDANMTIATKEEKCSYAFEKDVKSVNEVLQEFVTQIKISLEKWGETFRECDKVENLYPRRLDDIIKEAYCFEQQLNMQKDTLKGRLKVLTQTLASNPDKDER